jgi:hypothetical protein
MLQPLDDCINWPFKTMSKEQQTAPGSEVHTNAENKAARN